MAKAPHIEDCIIWPYARTRNGYGSVFVDGKWRSAHRHICEAAYGQAPAGYVAAHTCGKGHEGCVNRWHLRWTTYAENNSSDRALHGTLAIGEMNHSAKLTAADVLEIRTIRKSKKLTYAALAKRYGVSEVTIADAIAGRTWKHVSAV